MEVQCYALSGKLLGNMSRSELQRAPRAIQTFFQTDLYVLKDPELNNAVSHIADSWALLDSPEAADAAATDAPAYQPY